MKIIQEVRSPIPSPLSTVDPKKVGAIGISRYLMIRFKNPSISSFNMKIKNINLKNKAHNEVMSSF